MMMMMTLRTLLPCWLKFVRGPSMEHLLAMANCHRITEVLLPLLQAFRPLCSVVGWLVLAVVVGCCDVANARGSRHHVSWFWLVGVFILFVCWLTREAQWSTTVAAGSRLLVQMPVGCCALACFRRFAFWGVCLLAGEGIQPSSNATPPTPEVRDIIVAPLIGWSVVTPLMGQDHGCWFNCRLVALPCIVFV